MNKKYLLQRMILTLIVASSSLSGFAEKQAAEDIALSVVLDMNDACNARDVQRCLTFWGARCRVDRRELSIKSTARSRSGT